MARIAAALHAAGVPPTYGFTNGGFAANEPASRPALPAWRRSGNLLANHSWSHMNADENAAAAWEADVLRDEPVIAPLMKGADWHWLRFPYLAEGGTPAKRQEIRRFLGAHGYKIASVTMSFSDFLWNDPYARCVATGDGDAIATLKHSYLQAAADTLDYAEAASQQLYGREIPLVLLMHVGAFDSIMLPDLLRYYRSRGVRFVSLAEAESDPFYKGDVNPAAGAAPATLEADAAARKVTLSAAPEAPAALATLCR
jgi:peptidoglycan/xylan/chitin deacetylase (PgdA/CDA1 family)